MHGSRPDILLPNRSGDERSCLTLWKRDMRVWSDWNRWYPRSDPGELRSALGSSRPEGTFCRHLTTLMSRFQSVRHERSSPDRFGSKMSGREPCMAGGGAEDD